MKKFLLLLAFFPLFTELTAQTKRQKRAALEAQQRANQQLLQNLKAHVAFLSDDKLQGRATGTEGEKVAMEYISKQFKEAGLEPKGTNGFIQPFLVEDGKRIGEATRLVVNGQPLRLHSEFFPLAFSATTEVSGMPSIALKEKGLPWFTDVRQWLEDNRGNPHYDIEAGIRTEAERAAGKGATALIVYNSGKDVDNIRFSRSDKSAAVQIPVIFITADGAKKYLADKAAMLDMELGVDLNQRNRRGHNVVGFINNNAPSTVVIGAHYDHLGWGEDGGALDTGKVIHNGADDNASGTAALIELARLLKNSKAAGNNYLFIAFSGEELGLLGSKYWLDSPTVATPVNYMINMDMVGRYDESKKLAVGGYGTSAVWSDIFKRITDNKLQLKFDSTGSGPSDHAAFYRKNIPVLFFFTGTHTDYHKASDDHDKINYDGQLEIVRLVHRVVEATHTAGRLAFLKTTEPQVGAIRYSVSLGVIPDYSFSGGGLRIEGVSPKKLASRLGLEAGDILLQLGAYKIHDIQTYMQALGNFKPGDNTILRIKRGSEEKEFAVEF